MKKNYVSKFVQFCFCAALLFLVGFSKAQTILNYSYTGSMQSFTVPSCVSTITITVKGAQGGLSGDQATTGGLGGQAVGVLSVTAGNVLNIFVGGINGYNGGGAAGINQGCSNANGGVGGGASDVRLNGIALTDRVIVGAGGGGAGGNRINGCGRGAGGGGGAGYYGGGGGSGYPAGTPAVATGGTQSSGGAGGVSTFNVAQNGLAGAIGVGGGGGGETGSNQAGANSALQGGCGGGLVGCSGQQPSSNIYTGQSGAGGSNYTGTLTGTSNTQNVQTGNGVVTLSYIYGGGIVTATASNTLICSGTAVNFVATGAVSNYTWSNGSNSSSITLSPTTSTVISVSSTNTLNCISTSSVAITVNSGAPVLSVTTSTNSTCLGKTVTLTATGANTYTWTGGVTNGVSFAPSTTTTYIVSGQNACATSTAATTISVSPLAVSIVANPTIVCSGSTSTITTVSAGTSFSWAPVANNTSSLIASPNVNTVYSVVVSDGTCSGTASVAVNTNPIPTIAITPSFVNVCSGSSVSLTATGGLSYTWSANNATLSGNSGTLVTTPNAPTGYNVIGSNSFGCLSTAVSAILTNPSPTLIVSANPNLICSGDPVSISVSGATTYAWDTGATTTTINVNPSITTIYTVTGTANGCSSTETVGVSVFIPVLTISGTSSVCTGAVASVNSSSASSYAWTNGFSSQSFTIVPSTTTIYSLSALTSSSGINCPSSASFQVLVVPNPVVYASAQRTLMCRNESNTLSVSGANTYSWSTGATTSGFVITPTLITTNLYTVVGTSAAGCNGIGSVSVKINGCTGLNELDKLDQNIIVYPNPNNGDFVIKGNETIKINLFNALGQKINSFNIDEANNFEHQINGLNKGIYFITAENNTLELKQKIIVQ